MSVEQQVCLTFTWKAQFMYLYFLDEMELNNGYKELKHYRMLLGLQWFG
jgi:hypothetical protein